MVPAGHGDSDLLAHLVIGSWRLTGERQRGAKGLMISTEAKQNKTWSRGLEARLVSHTLRTLAVPVGIDGESRNAEGFHE